MSTNLVNLSNIRVNITQKAFDFTAWLTCCGTQLVVAENGATSFEVPANKDKAVPFKLPPQTSSISAPKTGNTVTLTWQLKRDKKVGTDSKTYDKMTTITVGAPASNMTVDLGKIGSITFNGEAPDEAEFKRKQDEAKLREQKEKERIAAEERQRQEQAEAERIRIENEKIEAERRAVILQQTLKEINISAEELVRKKIETFDMLDKQCDYGWEKIAEYYGVLKEAEEEERIAMGEASVPKPIYFPPLNPELRIARLFQDPIMEEEDVVYAAICAQPSSIPPATDSTINDIYTRSTISPDPFSSSASARRASNQRTVINNTATSTMNNNIVNSNASSAATSNYVNAIRTGTNTTSHLQHPPHLNNINQQEIISPQGRDNNNNNNNTSTSPARNNVSFSNQMIRHTPLDVLHDHSDPEALAANDPARQRFGAQSFDEDFGNLLSKHHHHGGVDVDENDPDYQPPEKLYRMRTNPLRSFGTAGADDLPPIDSIPRIRNGQYAMSNQQQNQQEKDEQSSSLNNNNNPISPKRGVTFVGDEKQQQLQQQHQQDSLQQQRSRKNNNNNSSNASSSTSTSAILLQEPLYTSPNSGGNNGSNKKISEKDVRFEMDLEPPPALMTALLHLSREGGNLSATIPIEHQRNYLESSPDNNNNNNRNGKSSPQNGSPYHHYSGGRNGSVSPLSNKHRHGSPNNGGGENSMTPRRKLPLVYTNIGEVVSKTKRHDDRAVPSFMRQKEIRLQTEDPAQSYWNCFAPQKARDLVGVRMPASAVTAFEEAATIQIERASPPRRVTGGMLSSSSGVPNAPRNLRTTSAPKNSLRILDGGESSSHRAARRW